MVDMRIHQTANAGIKRFNVRITLPPHLLDIWLPGDHPVFDDWLQQSFNMINLSALEGAAFTKGFQYSLHASRSGRPLLFPGHHTPARLAYCPG